MTYVYVALAARVCAEAVLFIAIVLPCFLVEVVIEIIRQVGPCGEDQIGRDQGGIRQHAAGVPTIRSLA